MDTFEGYIDASCICILQGEGTKPPYIFDKPLVALTNNSSCPPLESYDTWPPCFTSSAAPTAPVLARWLIWRSNTSSVRRTTLHSPTFGTSRRSAAVASLCFGARRSDFQILDHYIFGFPGVRLRARPARLLTHVVVHACC